MPNRSRRIALCVALLLCCPATVSGDDKPPQKGGMAGYLLPPIAGDLDGVKDPGESTAFGDGLFWVLR